MKGTIHTQYLPKVDWSYMIRHKTYITIANHPQYESRLLNQYDLAEVNSAKAGVSEPIPDAFRQSSYRRWLWDNMQDDRNVIWRELSLLADACEAGLDITIIVHAGAVHAEIIANAVHWMMAHTDKPVDNHGPRQRRHHSSFPLDDDFPPNIGWNRIVWITGKTCSKLAYLYETDAVITALVPGHEELIKTGRWHWTPNVKHWEDTPHYMHKCWWKLDGLVDHFAEALQRFNDSQRTDLVAHRAASPYDERYNPWRKDALLPDPAVKSLEKELATQLAPLPSLVAQRAALVAQRATLSHRFPQHRPPQELRKAA